MAPVLAGKGVCVPDPTTLGGTTTTIQCLSSTCIGEIEVTYQLNWCSPDPESPCAEVPAYLRATVQPYMKEGSWSVFVRCAGLGAACATAGALFCLSPPWVTCLLGVAGVSLVCAGLNPSAFDYCCWSTCPLDMATLKRYGGGRTC